jgi:hypothetical protein
METQTKHIRRQADMAERQARLISTQAKQMEEQTAILRDSVAAAKKAADAAESSAKAAMGIAVPTLMISEFRFKANPDAWERRLRCPELLISVKNYGQSPAILHSHAVQFTCEELPDVADYPPRDYFDDGTAVEKGESFPLDPLAITPMGMFSEEDAHAIAEGKKYLAVYGCVWYGDVFGPKLRKLRFCKGLAGFDPYGRAVIWADLPVPADSDDEEQPQNPN